MTETKRDDATLVAVIKVYEALKERRGELAAVVTSIQNKLSVTPPWEHARREMLLAQLEKANKEVRQATAAKNAARIEADIADRELRASAPRAQAPSVPQAPFNDAQVEHLRLLATRIRSTEYRMAARVKAALDFVAIVLPLLSKKA